MSISHIPGLTLTININYADELQSVTRELAFVSQSSLLRQALDVGASDVSSLHPRTPGGGTEGAGRQHSRQGGCRRDLPDLLHALLPRTRLPIDVVNVVATVAAVSDTDCSHRRLPASFESDGQDLSAD